ncbi:MAG: pyridoxamine kinase [Clostridia bacterium]|nr:pyridoxamine kinase [Clostridia bacterium]
MKRIVTVQDISAVGKCSLTVALPIISACGVECAVMPTAVLSTHTQFSGFTFHDLTEEIAPITAHWKKEGLDFSAVYTGYLGSFEQIRLVEEMYDTLKTPETLLIVDPAMADGGKLYHGFTPEFALRMGKLCTRADLILPNLTEACFMLEEDYPAEYDRPYIQSLLKRLCATGAKRAALTGVSYEEGRLGVEMYDSTTGKFFSYFNEHLPVSFHGTGDIFASAVVGVKSLGKSFEEALTVAVDYTLECIRLTLKDPDHPTYGVNFEEAIPYLISLLQK